MTAAFPSVALVRRELLTMLRGQRPYGLFFAAAAAAMGLALFNYPNVVDERVMGRMVMQYQAADFVRTFLYTLFAGTVLCVPAFAAGAIVLERERGTFDFLRMTLARPSGMLASKLINAVGFYFLLMLGLAPILATTFFLPGVDVPQFIAAFLVIAATAVSCAAAGLMCSALVRRSLVAIALSYVGVAAIWVLPLILLSIVVSAVALVFDIRSVAGTIQALGMITVPVAQLALTLQAGVDDSLLLSLAYQGVLTLACLYIAHRWLVRPMNPPRVELRKPVDDRKVLRARRTTWPYYLVDPLRRKKPIEDRRNPMLVREVRWGLVNRGTILIRLFYVSATIYFFAGVIASLENARDYRQLTSWLLTQIVLTIIVAPALTANAITKEIELGNLDMLRITLLRPRDIIAGKFTAAAFTLIPMMAASLVALIPTALLVRPDWRPVAMAYVTLGVCAALSLSISIFFSTVLRRTLTAIVCSYLASAVAFIGLTFAVNFAVRLFIPTGEDEPFFMLSPILSLILAMNTFHEGHGAMAYLYWTLGTGIWSAVTLALIVASILLFSRKRMRDP